MKRALLAVLIFLGSMFASAGLLRLDDVPAVIFGGILAGIFLVATNRSPRQPSEVPKDV